MLEPLQYIFLSGEILSDSIKFFTFHKLQNIDEQITSTYSQTNLFNLQSYIPTYYKNVKFPFHAFLSRDKKIHNIIKTN